MTFRIDEDVKIELYGSTSFIIGQSKLGGPALLGDLSPTWHPLTCGVVSVDIDRGFSVNQSILPTLEVGTASIVLSGFAVDPTLNPLFELNAEIRVLIRPPGETEYSPIFTGFVDDIQTSYSADGYITTSMQCTDWLSKILNVTVDAGAYIAPEENFATRVNRIFDDFILPAYPDIEISPAWFPEYGGSTFPEEFGDRGTTTTGELLNEVMQGEAGMIVASRTGVVYGFGRYYYDYLMDELDLGTVGDDFGFSNQHSTSQDHFCMGDIETAFGKNDIANEITARFSGNVALAADEEVVKRNTVTINALGNLPFDVDLYVAVGPTGSEDEQLQSWADDLTLPEGETRVRSLTWSPIRRDGLLNNSWDWDPGYAITRVRIEYPSHNIDGKYIVSRLSHSITPENWTMSAELWKGI
jgi:hypothetical protein